MPTATGVGFADAPTQWVVGKGGVTVLAAVLYQLVLGVIAIGCFAALSCIVAYSIAYFVARCCWGFAMVIAALAIAVGIVGVVGSALALQAVMADFGVFGLFARLCLGVVNRQQVVRGVVDEVLGYGAVDLGETVEGVVVVLGAATVAVVDLGELAAGTVVIVAPGYAADIRAAFKDLANKLFGEVVGVVFTRECLGL